MAGRLPSNRIPLWRRLAAFSFDRRVILGASAMLFLGLGLMLAVLEAPLPAWVNHVSFVAMWLCLGSSLVWLCLVLCALSVLFVVRIVHDVPFTLDVLRHSLPPRGATIQEHRQWRAEQVTRIDRLDVLPIKLGDVLTAPPPPPDHRPWWRRALASAGLGYAGMLGLVLIHPAAPVLFIPLALMSLLLLLWPDRGETSPLRRWWLRLLLTGFYAAGLAIETSILSLAVYGAPAEFFGLLIGFAAIAALLLLAGIACGLLTLMRRGAHQPAPAGRSSGR